MLKDVSELRVPPTATLRETITVISGNRRQIALVLDDDERLLGLVTDGDIRRAILRGVELDDPVTDVMNASPKVARAGDDPRSITGQLDEFSIRHLPMLDEAGRVVALHMVGDRKHPAEATTPVVLMAGGRGERLYPLTKDVPKPMLPIGGVPLVEIILRGLAQQGFVNVQISVNYLAGMIIDHVGDGSAWGLRVTYLHEEKPLGTAGALAALRGQIDEPFIVMNSDLLTKVDLRELLSFHGKQGGAATVGVREHLLDIPYGVVNLDGASVQSIVEKPVHRSMVSAGIYALDAWALELVEPGTHTDMPTLLGRIMDDGHTVAAFPIHESWLDVGRPEDLDQARTDAARWIAR